MLVLKGAEVWIQVQKEDKTKVSKSRTQAL